MRLPQDAQRSQLPEMPTSGDLPERVDGALEGSWAAVRWHYASLGEPGRTVDVVSDLSGSVTLSVSGSRYVITWDAPPGGRSSADGRISRAADGALAFEPTDGPGAEQIAWRFTDATLAMSSDRSAWDFDGRGEEPAAFTAVLVRL